MKLVKPPEKKPVGPSSKPAQVSKPVSKQPPPQKQSQKGGGNIDILDLDFNAASQQINTANETPNLLMGATSNQAQPPTQNTASLFEDVPAPAKNVTAPPVQSESPPTYQNFSFQMS